MVALPADHRRPHPHPRPHPRLRVIRPDEILDLVRVDALPERTDYVDDGCSLAPSCLRCPLPRCKYDLPGGAQRLTAEQRAREIVLLRTKYGASIRLLEAAYGVTERQVFRILKNAGYGQAAKREARTSPIGSTTPASARAPRAGESRGRARHRRAVAAPASTTSTPTMPSATAAPRRTR